MHNLWCTRKWNAILIIGIGLCLFALSATAQTITIGAIEDLQKIGNDPGYPLSGHYSLTQDIDASSTAAWNDGAGFLPIGKEGNAFSGVFDGNGHVITGLTINRPGSYDVGLFGCINHLGTVRNLGLAEVAISGYTYVGGIVGNALQPIVSSCYVTGMVSGNSMVGGLAGRNNSGTVTSCYTMCSVSGSSNVGGLVGYSSHLIFGSYATGTVSGGGGLVGNTSAMYNGRPATASFWDIESSGQPDSSGGKGLTTSQMKTLSIFQNAGWNAYGWVMEDGHYPRLPWEDTGMPAIPPAGAPPLSGNGTEMTPYLVGTSAEFMLLPWYASLLDKYIRLTSDLDFSGVTVHPIGDLGVFTGKFDGAGHVLSNITLDRAGNDFMGVFAALGAGGEIRELGVENIVVTGNRYVSALAGNNRGIIRECFVTGAVAGNTYVGGITGANRLGVVTSCYAITSVSGGGGIVGDNREGTLSYSYATGPGALVQDNFLGTVTASFWDMESSGLLTCAGGIGLTTAQMKTVQLFQQTGWGAQGWTMENGQYPRLAWENTGASPIPPPQSIPLVGTGTPGEPYLVGTPEEFALLSLYTEALDKYIMLTDTLNCSDVTLFPIGFLGTFTGVFMAEGHTLSNIVIHQPGIDYAGIFATVGAGGRIENLIVQDCTVSGGHHTGGLVAVNNGVIDNCQISGDVSSTGNTTGGLVGANSGTITNSNALGTVSGWNNVGGLCGSSGGAILDCGVNCHVQGMNAVGGLLGVNSGEASQCYAFGTVEGNKDTGGFAGSNSGTILSCFATGPVTGAGDYAFIGGLVGGNSGAITACYATGAVIADGEGAYVAGLVGGMSGGLVSACYATGKISSANSDVNGLVGLYWPYRESVLLSFWDMETSETCGSRGGKGVTTARMKTVKVFQNANWAEYGWMMNDGVYPRLGWENTGASPVPSPEPIPFAGNGTESSPYLITTPEEFALLSWRADILDTHIQLAQDVDCSDLAIYPIGDLGRFTGVLDGGGYAVRHAVMDRSENSFAGLFAIVGANTEIRNLGIKDGFVSGRWSVGGLVGWNEGTITNCHNSGSVSGETRVGGLVGTQYGESVTNCSTTGSITASGETLGGIIGYNNGGTVTDSYATGNIAGYRIVGGLIGSNSAGGFIARCFAMGDVSASTVDAMAGFQVGGLVGMHMGNMISQSFATGNVDGKDSVGGLTGTAGDTVANSYATGAVSGRNRVGGLSGVVTFVADISNCYSIGTVSGFTNLGGLGGSGSSVFGPLQTSFWNTDISGPDNGIGVGLSTASMLAQSTFESAGWDFSGSPPVWVMHEGMTYPHLYGLPVPVYSLGSLQAMSHGGMGSDRYFLTDDIEAWNTDHWEDKSLFPGFLPVGTAAQPFNGVLEGRGHCIRGLRIMRPSLDGVGLFGHIGPSGVVRGVGLEQAAITGRHQVGGLAGVNLGIIEQCYMQGTVSGEHEVGGLLGRNSGEVSESYAAGTLSGVTVGGLVGVANGGGVSASFWDITLSDALVSGGGQGLPTPAMQTGAVFHDTGWDLEDTWTLAEGRSYPYFRNSTPLRILSGPPRLINADTVEIALETFYPDIFVTVGGGAYPAWYRIDKVGPAVISVSLKQEAFNALTLSVLPATGREKIIAQLNVYESVAFPATPMQVNALMVYPDFAIVARDGSHEFECVATFADGTTATITPAAIWNASDGLITGGGLYTHATDGAGAVIQALLPTEQGWRYSNTAVVALGKQEQDPTRDPHGLPIKSEQGLVSGMVRSHYTGLGLGQSKITAYPVFGAGVAAQHAMYDTLGNYVFTMGEGLYHFEGIYSGFRSEMVRGGLLLERPRMVLPDIWSDPYYSGQVKADRPLQYDFFLRPNDAQAPWVYYVEPPASRTVNQPQLVVTAINADKYSELEVATFTLNANAHDIRERISSTGFYRDTWPLQLGMNVLHLYSMDTEGNAAERTIEVIYDPAYDPSGYAPPPPDGPPPVACTRMSIVNLVDGLSVRGNAVTLLAESISGDLDAVDAVSFEARGAGTGDAWLVVDTSLAAPHVVTWNTDVWPEGTYQLRAVAISLDGCVDSHAPVVEVSVDAGAAYHERVAAGVHTLTAPVPANADTVLVLLDGPRFARILIPAGTLASNDLLTAFFPTAAAFNPALTPWQQDAGLYLHVSLTHHSGDFLNGSHASLEVGYPDANGDGLLDGSGLPVSQLTLRHLPAPAATFVPLPASRVSWSRQCVIGETRHFSVFGMVADQPASPLNLVTTALPDGAEGAAYSVVLGANGGIPPYSWGIVNGALPPGLSINGDVLEGVPTTSGNYSFTLQVADAQTILALQSITLGITVFAATQPTVTVRRADSQPGITNTLPIRWDILFSEPVTGFDTGDIVLTGTAHHGAVYAITGAGATYALEVTALPYDGALLPTVPANVAGNNRASSGGEPVWVDRKAPMAVFSRLHPGGSVTTTDTLPVAFSLLFDEAVTGLNTSGIAFAPEVAGVTLDIQGSGKNYTLLVTGLSGAAAVMPVLLPGAAQDAAGNGNPEITYHGPVVQYTPDARPTVTLNQSAGQPDPTGEFPIVFVIAFSEPVNGFTVDDVAYLDLPDKAPNPVYTLIGSGANYTLTVTGANGDGRLAFRVPETAGWRASTSMDNVVRLDTTPPTLTIGAPSPERSWKGPVSFPLTYSGANAITLAPADITMNGAPTATIAVSGTGTRQRVVTLSAIDGPGSLGISIAAGTAVDGAGNFALPAGPSATAHIEAPPSVEIRRAVGQPAYATTAPVFFEIIFDRPVVGFAAHHVQMLGSAPGVAFSLDGEGPAYTLTVTDTTGDGTVRPRIPAGVCVDDAGNPNEASLGANGVVTLDTTPPTVTISRASGQPDPTNSLPVLFTLIFSEPVTGFSPGSVNMGGTATGATFGVSGSGAVYTLSITGISEDGTVVPTLPAGVCQDMVGNWNLASTGANNSVTYDTTSPTFINIEATPSPAGENAGVTISFHPSEALDGLPTVTVNGNPAAHVSHVGLDYVFSYIVQGGDPNGPATLIISGTDLANNFGQTESTSALVIDHTKPTANFSASPRAGMPPLTVTFMDLSTPVSATPITNWTWDFGDGTPQASGQSPAPHSYTAAGVYTVTLTITDNATNTDGETKTAYIVVGGPTAGFTATPQSGYAPMFVQFTDTSDAGATPISAWHWDFGDGATSAESNPGHTYANPGIYDVSLTVITAVTTDTTVEHALIQVQPGISPAAAFTATPTFGMAPLTVQFTDTSDTGSSPIEHWHWNFGDDMTSAERDPEHVFADVGVYTVSLTVTTVVGSDTRTMTGYIQIIAAMPTSKLLGLALLAALLSIGAIARHRRKA